jgi:hypothetical protein
MPERINAELLEAARGVGTLYAEMQIAMKSLVNTPAWDVVTNTVRQATRAVADAEKNLATEPEPDVWQLCIAQGVKLSANYELAAKLDEDGASECNLEWDWNTVDLVETLDSDNLTGLLRLALRQRDALYRHRNAWADKWIEDNQDKVQQYRNDQAESLAADNAERDQDARREW